MTRICFVSYEIHPTVKGGCGVFLYNTARTLLPQGHELIFLLDIPPESFRQFDQVDRLDLPCAHNCRAYQVESLTADLRYTQNDFRSIFEFRAYRFHIAAERIYRIEKPEIIEFFDYCGVSYIALTAKAAGLSYTDARLAVRLHNSMELIDRRQPPELHNIERYLMYGLEHHALRLAENVLYPSDTFWKSEYRLHYENWFGEVLLSEPPLIDIPRWISLGNNQEIILFYGRLHGIKGVDLFIDAAVHYLNNPRNPPRQFYLVGYDSYTPPGYTGSYQAYLLRKIPPDLHQHFHFTGQLSWHELETLLPHVLYAIIPSYSESFSYAAHELYAAGIPLIVSDIPAFRGYFHHEENALLFDGTTYDLARQMERLSADVELRESITLPYPVTQIPLGDFYSASHRSSWVNPPSTDIAQPSLLVCIVCDQPNLSSTKWQSIRASLPEKSFVVIMRPTETGNTGEVVAWFLGRLYLFEDENGQPLKPTQILTQDTLLVMRASDMLEKRFLEIGLDTLARQSQIAFVGSWRRIHDGNAYKIETFPYDAALELLPLVGQTLFSRFIMRTNPSQLLIDLFDPRAGRLGEVAYLWKLDNGEQCGLIIPEPLITQEVEDEQVLEGNAFDYLILQDDNPRRKKRLARYLLTLPLRAEVLPVRLPPGPILSPAVSDRRKWADRLRATPLNRWLNRYPRLKSAILKALRIRKS